MEASLLPGDSVIRAFLLPYRQGKAGPFYKFKFQPLFPMIDLLLCETAGLSPELWFRLRRAVVCKNAIRRTNHPVRLIGLWPKAPSLV